MIHFTSEQWSKYVKNELEEEVRDIYENHLYECDQCFELYLQAMDEAQDGFPAISNEQQFTDELMKQIQPVEKTVPFYQKTAFQYMLAAAMTIFLMASGVFQSIFQIVEGVNDPVAHYETTSLTDGLMNKAIILMDTIDISNKGGNDE